MVDVIGSIYHGRYCQGTKSIKTDAEDNDKILPSDSDSSLSDIECNTCSTSFPTVNSYKMHLHSKKHYKKVAEAKFLSKNSLTNKKNESDEDDDDDSKGIHCEVCDKYVTGYISYATHIKGSGHAKNIRKHKLEQKLENMPEVLTKGNDDDDDLQKPYARCSICQKEFSGPEPLQLHMNSPAHKKKAKQIQTMHSVKAKYDDGTKKSDDEAFFSKCDLCQKTFTGVIPYEIHMKSGAHKKSVEKKKVAEELKEFYSIDDSVAGYVCKECKKTFTDPLALKSHLANNSHEKQKAKNAIAAFLTSYPEILFVTPLDDNEDSGESDDDIDSKYYLICKLCHMSFSGPKSAQDHVKSKKHISVKKEKEILKALKEQKENSKVKSSDKDGADIKPSAKKISRNEKEKGSGKIHADNLEDF